MAGCWRNEHQPLSISWSGLSSCRVVGAIAGVALAVLLSSCSRRSGTTTTEAKPKQVALFGDSRAWEAEPYYIHFLLEAHEVAHTYDTYGGTAICDWFQRMREVEAQYHPGAVDLEFSRNNLTPA